MLVLSGWLALQLQWHLIFLVSMNATHQSLTSIQRHNDFILLNLFLSLNSSLEVPAQCFEPVLFHFIAVQKSSIEAQFVVQILKLTALIHLNVLNSSCQCTNASHFLYHSTVTRKLKNSCLSIKWLASGKNTIKLSISSLKMYKNIFMILKDNEVGTILPWFC